MAAPSSDERDDSRRPPLPRLVAGKPFEVVDGRLVKLDDEDWERQGKSWPELDDHILDVDQPWELVEGRLIEMPPAFDDHGRSHARLSTLLETHVVDGYISFVDVLTRFAATSNFAPDASVLPAYDPSRQARPLEELAFEICSKQRLSVNADKARIMAERGVRRIFCLELGRTRVLEWDRAVDDWRTLPAGASIDDRCLVRSLPVSVLLDTTRCDAAVVRALRARNVPELDAIRSEGRSEGLAIALLDTLSTRGLEPDAASRRLIASCNDVDRLRVWLRRAITAARVEDIFAGDDEVG